MKKLHTNIELTQQQAKLVSDALHFYREAISNLNFHKIIVGWHRVDEIEEIRMKFADKVSI